MKRILLALLSLLSLAAIGAAVDQPASTDHSVKVVLVGDSTVQSGSGWGDAFIPLLKPEVKCVNLGKGGRSSKSYRAEGWWKKTLEEKPAYILIQFGHNDQPGKGPARETDPQSTFPENLTRYIEEARAAGAKPILVTSLVRRNFGTEGKLNLKDQIPYVEATRKVAAEQKVELVDLFARSQEQVEKLGPEAAKVIDADAKGQLPGSGGDRTHLGPKGAEMTAPLVAEELRRIKSPLAEYLR
jgi:pectinesterase